MGHPLKTRRLEIEKAQGRADRNVCVTEMRKELTGVHQLFPLAESTTSFEMELEFGSAGSSTSPTRSAACAPLRDGIIGRHREERSIGFAAIDIRQLK
jgi:hypothetical protein